MEFFQFRVNSPQVVRETNDEDAAVVLVENGCYYSLDRVGADVWRLIAAGADMDAIVAVMARRYNAPAGEVHAAIEMLLTELEEEGLITAADAPGAFPLAEPSEEPRQWSRPRLSKFGGVDELFRPRSTRPGSLAS